MLLVEGEEHGARIRIAEAGSRVQVSAMAGDVTVQGARGRVDVSTVAGAVVLDDIRGDVTATTVSGGVTLRDLGSRLVRVRSTQGTLSYTGPVLSGARYELVTHAGDVRLAIPREASAQLSVSTWSGSVSSAFPIRLQPGVHGVGTAASKQYTFEIGGGAARITAASFAGNIIITTIGRSE